MNWQDILKDSARATPKCATCGQEHYKHEECPETKKSIGTVARLGAAVLSGDDDETKGIATAAKIGALAINDGEEKSDVEKLYFGTKGDAAEHMKDMVQQLQEIEEGRSEHHGDTWTPEITLAFDDATQALGKLQTLLA